MKRMKNSTHYLFSLGLTNLYGMFCINEFRYSLMVIPLSLITSCLSWVPNIVDRYISTQFESEGVVLARNRHPLSHSPWTFLYFVPILYLVQKLDYEIIEMILVLMILSWVSHLFLDSLNPGGLPLGKKPIFSNHPVKHYNFHSGLVRKNKRLRIAKIQFNDLAANRKLGQLGLFIFSLNFARFMLSFLGGRI